MNAMEMLMKSAMDKLLENIPPETLEQVGQISQFVRRLDQRLDRIEARQLLIMEALKIPADTQQEALSHDQPNHYDRTAGE